MAKAKTKAAKLKVFRTVIGFHDAYVAAPTKKAALAAWGSSKDLFGRGIAEQVTDEELMAEPLAAPGTVIKRLRGTEAEQIAALPADKPKKQRLADGAAETAPSAKKAKKAKPRPSRAALDAAEAAIARAEEQNAEALAAIVRREKALAEEKSDLRREQEEAFARLEQVRDEAQASYERAIDDWRD
ncbi:hypothetical protein Q4F19_11700 [Sphingomonas sp. BIUV-7]|uniref:Cell envelope biogenesis protein TolA n=1 Tax=Sphingomonas natans TaxID=3063330 RepID=A0ABT8Y9P7_9SPHN|nr:hypothetical protein [Sphingomonas sp. BIUV-7]MDO6415045.1 hypothetical protein [Sphingomonas sp. BIUV-7]